jgi:hypothetical protein
MTDYIIATTVGTILLILWVLRRITTPFKCNCGYQTMFTGSFKKHLLKGHKWIDHN